jgi:hypothetical protein
LPALGWRLRIPRYVEHESRDGRKYCNEVNRNQAKSLSENCTDSYQTNDRTLSAGDANVRPCVCVTLYHASEILDQDGKVLTHHQDEGDDDC